MATVRASAVLLCVLLAGCSGGDGLRKPGTEVARDEAPAGLAATPQRAGGTDGSPPSVSPAFAGVLAPGGPPGPANDLAIGFEDSQAASLSRDVVGTSVMDDDALPGRVPSLAPAPPAAPLGMLE